MALGKRVSELDLGPLTPVDAHATIRIADVVPRDRSLNFTQFRDLPTFVAPLSMDRHDVPTQVAGLCKRVLRQTPVISHPVLLRFQRFVSGYIHAHLTPLIDVLSFEDWLSDTGYSEHRKDELRKAANIDNFAPPPRSVSATVKSFGKLESYDQNKNLRWINSRSDRFKAYAGRFFKSIEAEVYKIGYFVKHQSMVERAARVASLEKQGCRYFASDFTSFEAHFAPQFMLACECQLYDYMLSNFPGVSRYLDNVITGKCSASTRAGVHFTVKGRRMSGDMCTSLGNGFSNLMLWMFFMQENCVQWFDGLVEGDDGLFAINGSPPTIEQFALLGFVVKIDEISVPTEASFCGIVSAGQNVRDPARFVRGFCWYEGAPTSLHHERELLRAKALSALYESPACPVVSALASYALELTTGVNPVFKTDGYHPVYPSKPPPSVDVLPCTRFLFEKMYGISVAAQIEIECALIRGDLSSLDIIVHHPDVLLYSSDYTLT